MFDSPPPNLPVEPGAMPPKPVVPLAPGAPQVPAPRPMSSPSGKKEPEDIFAGLDTAPSPAPAVMPDYEAPRRSPLKLILVIVAILVVLGAAGIVVWRVFLTPKVETVAPTPTSPNPAVVPVTPQPVVETPPVQPVETQPAAPVTTAPSGTNVPPPQPINQPTPVAVVKPTEAIDTDGDGLSDSEEVIFGTNPTVVDSDGDGFADGAEVKNGYDPAVKGGKLSDSPRFQLRTFGNAWDALLPKDWTLGADSAAPGDTLILTGTPATFSVHISPAPSGTDFRTWLASNEPTLDAASMTLIKTRGGYDAYQTADRLTAYVITNTAIVVVRYLANTATSYDYRTLYDLMIQTLSAAK